jgi:hypothetical protein
LLVYLLSSIYLFYRSPALTLGVEPSLDRSSCGGRRCGNRA